MIAKEVTFGKHPLILACDAQCNKAWGINNRPKVFLDSIDEEDFAWLADHELGEAPINPGTYEGGHAKPRTESERLNKWCARECERHALIEIAQPIVLRDFTKRFFNYTDKNRKLTSKSYTFEITHPGEPGAGQRFYSDTITITVASGDPGGESGDFEEFMMNTLKDYFDGAKVTFTHENIKKSS